ncbi:putative telomere length regulation protein elg1 [Rosellinia necatrix]|uniref:Putative telomere length regulation protein elg1 n=1 Tax=Rosellinia necatrix TaxID=77044 RepID=A0A1W2TKS7_ROSNE|nr:putative telomere length regulation protein elg1 [Rosellinia necatrix]
MAEASNGAEVQLKKVHPFFSGSHATPKLDDAVTPPTPESSCSGPTSDESRNDPIEHENNHEEPGRRQRKRRKTDSSALVSETQLKAPRQKRRKRVSAGPSIIKHFGQGTASDKQLAVERSQDDERIHELPDESANPPAMGASKLAVEGNHNSINDPRDRNPCDSACNEKPKKLLMLNLATGTIGPPPSNPLTPAPTSATPLAKKRGRKRRALVVPISYGTDAASRERLGQRISEILLGISRVSPSTSKDAAAPTTPSSGHETSNDKVAGTTPKESTQQKTAIPKRPAHPFFQAKGKLMSSNEDGSTMKKDKTPPKRQVIFTSTPCSPKRTRSAPLSSSHIMNLNKGSMKIPGAQYPAWPWRGVVHVRDGPPAYPMNNTGGELVPVRSRARKAKGQAVCISERESILCESAAKLRIHQLAEELKSTNDEELRPIAPLLRVPTKHFESGRKLQARVRKELHTLRNNGAVLKTHPAIIHAYDSIATKLSAFDMSTCESVSWAQKYAPTSAHCILQTGREAELLRDWLQTLKVQAVDTGASDSVPKSKGASTLKKKRGRKKLDGFVVSSDEEENEMDEIYDDEPDQHLRGGRGDAKKTVVRSGDTVDRGGKLSSRLTNAVLLSGPHGCGKTATVYAIAKELDFEVFEINAGARRSGKDILERVGDMTRNHLVHHQQKDDPQGDSAVEDEVTKDLKSGKQSTMASFFKPKPSKPITQAPKVEQIGAEAPVLSSLDKKPCRDQKQSLILLEEVDILYEEDKQFWATVITMIAQSKRPFIMTCNNESVVPLQNLKLHGIFRFSPPPSDVAVDMLLLIAANEGHALGRHAVEALYESRNHDLRAAITELNYWCQIGVGDLRGGFDWFYPRWPKGSDVDEEGQTIRVVSQDTYHTGMGWLNRDLTTAESSLPSIVPDLHGEVWNHWGLDVSDHHDFEDSSSWAKKATEKACSREARLSLLQSVEAFADSMSDSDICGPFLSPLSDRIALDPTMPGLHAKTLDDFTIGDKILEVTPLCYYDSISLGVSTSLRILARSKLMSSEQSQEQLHTIKRFDEKRVTSDIKHYLERLSQLENPITRKNYSIAFDPIAVSEKILANGYLDPSIFDREMTPLCLDVAPYVRSIVSYDQRLHKERRMRSNLLSEGGEPEKKRMRTTRAALSALEGGSRATIRRERYFAADINPYLVMYTGGKDWDKLAHQALVSEVHTSLGSENGDANVDARLDEF